MNRVLSSLWSTIHTHTHTLNSYRRLPNKQTMYNVLSPTLRFLLSCEMLAWSQQTVHCCSLVVRADHPRCTRPMVFQLSNLTAVLLPPSSHTSLPPSLLPPSSPYLLFPILLFSTIITTSHTYWTSHPPHFQSPTHTSTYPTNPVMITSRKWKYMTWV